MEIYIMFIDQRIPYCSYSIFFTLIYTFTVIHAESKIYRVIQRAKKPK